MVLLQELMDRCLLFFKDHCYSASRITVYKCLWRKGIERFMSENNLTEYSPSVGQEFIATCHTNGIVTPSDREKIRSVQVLDDMLNLGYIRKRCNIPVHHDLPGEIGAEMEKFVSHLVSLRRSQITIDKYRLYLSEFLSHLTLNGVTSVEMIEERHIVSFFSSHPTDKTWVKTAIGGLYRYWKENEVTDRLHDDFFANFKVKQREALPSFYSTEEVVRMENSINRSSGTGKRDYAMFLLASRLGLRASDIAGLQFSDIDWEKNCITLTMKKTHKAIELPLLADVGNAIIDYLQYGRPVSILKNVFISTRAPYTAATKLLVCSAIDRIIRSSGVRIDGKHHGPHSLRHSIASAMLQSGSTMPVISESLGHSNTEITMKYIKIDLESLAKCALPVPEISRDFYLQKGGAFYG